MAGSEDSYLGGAIGPSTVATTPPSRGESRSLWKRIFGKSESCPAQAKPSYEAGDGDVRHHRRLSGSVLPGIFSPGTSNQHQQQSEKRDKLEPESFNVAGSRARFVDYRTGSRARPLSAKSCPDPSPRVSAPGNLGSIQAALDSHSVPLVDAKNDLVSGKESGDGEPPHPAAVHLPSRLGFTDELLDELEKRWILNLSMHFRDRSNREKFFVTYAEHPNCWRRVTISTDYREAAPGSLESELQRLEFQRDKSARIYESIRDSLSEIQFYDTVTNLKIQTLNGRIHVHVTEDVIELVTYPAVSAIAHLPCLRVPENEVEFVAHLSGFVYKVTVDGETLIKKEIPGPDTIEEFLYEMNALYRLAGSGSVISFRGVVTDIDDTVLKGLLISCADQGALVDILFDNRGRLDWIRRQRWAKQIVQGLSEIHEAGFVQGDFTLSNIVVDVEDNAKIIDINRRGCPVGWEPPEIVSLLESKQRISMYIGIKSDIFQLGMVLWAIAMENDEPEAQRRPLDFEEAPPDIPGYYKALVAICLSDDPRNRINATALLNMFPDYDYYNSPRQEPYHQVHEIPEHPGLFHTAEVDEARPLSMDEAEDYGRPSAPPSETGSTESQGRSLLQTTTSQLAPTTNAADDGATASAIERTRSISPLGHNDQSHPLTIDMEKTDDDMNGWDRDGMWDHGDSLDLPEGLPAQLLDDDDF